MRPYKFSDALGKSTLRDSVRDRKNAAKPKKRGPSVLLVNDIINIRGESYRLKDRRKAGLVPPRGQEGAEAAVRSLASDSVAPKARQKTALGSTPFRGQGGPSMEVRGGEFSTGIDMRIKRPSPSYNAQPQGGSYATGA